MQPTLIDCQPQIPTLMTKVTNKRLETERYLGINLTRDVKDLYSRNYKSLLKDIEEDTKRWKNIPCSRTGRINIVKMSKLPNLHFQCYPGQNNNDIFQRTGTNSP